MDIFKLGDKILALLEAVFGFWNNQIDHRSYERQDKLKVPTIHEGADARKIEEKYLTGQISKGSWKVEENQMIKKQNALLQKVIATLGKV